MQIDLAVSLDGAGSTAAAESEYRAALERQAAFPEALGSLGRLLARTGRPAEAIPFFDRFLTAHAGHPAAVRVRRWRSEALAALGRKR